MVDAKHHLRKLLESFDTAMLITRHGGRLHARPMAVAAVESPNTLWFVTALPSPKTAEIRDNDLASATFQSSARFVAVSGRAALVTDRDKIKEVWKEQWKVWFPDGKDDPNVALIRVTVDDAEYWDNAGAAGILHAFEAAKALVSGEKPAPMDDQHARIKA